MQQMRIVNGAYRGEQVTLLAVDFDHFCVQVRFDAISMRAIIP